MNPRRGQCNAHRFAAARSSTPPRRPADALACHPSSLRAAGGFGLRGAAPVTGPRRPGLERVRRQAPAFVLRRPNRGAIGFSTGCLRQNRYGRPGCWCTMLRGPARPTGPRALVQECVRQIGGHLALPIGDTVKKAARTRREPKNRRDAGRTQLWPRRRRRCSVPACYAGAAKARGPVTDEASAVEQMGLKPKLVPGSRENFKVTWPEDLSIAESILKRRQ